MKEVNDKKQKLQQEMNKRNIQGDKQQKLNTEMKKKGKRMG